MHKKHSRGDTQKVLNRELSVLFATHRHDLFYITLKYHQNTPNIIQAIELTRKYLRTDGRQTDARLIVILPEVSFGEYKCPNHPQPHLHCDNIRRFYGKITGNQLQVHFALFFTGTRKHFSGIRHRTAAKDIIIILSYSPTILQRYFRVLSVNITLPYLDF